jgi:protein-S-isoprenylcysteine O-methyltransferase Ste14
VKPKKVIPPLYFFVLLLLSIALGVYLPIFKVLPTRYRYMGIAPIAVGVVLNLWTDSLFKKNKTTVKPHLKPSTLVTSGVFQFTRNPMYLGMTLILFGVSGCVGSITAFVSPVVFFLICERQFIPLEEFAMEDVFGERYLEYKRRVRRWV